MTTYNTYQEAKIANPESDIFFMHNGEYRTGEWIYQHNFGRSSFTLCNPADHCMTVEKFLSDGHKFVEGDIVFDVGRVSIINEGFEVEAYNEPDLHDGVIYILRAAALENIPTETTEEKEVLDGIESAGEVEWKSGDTAMLYGDQVLVIAYHPHHPVVVVETNDNEYLNVGISDLSKPETPQQRKDRERLEAVKEMFSYWSDDEIDFNSGDEDDRWVKELLFSLYCAGYRKVEL